MKKKKAMDKLVKSFVDMEDSLRQKPKSPPQPQIDGYVEIWGGVHPCNINLHADGYFSIYIDGDLNDGPSCMDDFLDDCKGMLYKSLDDYKKDKAIDLKKWIEDSGWVEDKE